MDSLKIILVIFGTFLIAFLTSLLLELQIFQNVLRYVLVVLLIMVEFYFGFIIFKYLTTQNKK